MIDLRGRTAVITGGGRGVGAAIARRLAEAGAAVLVAARTREDVEKVAGDLATAGHLAFAATCDVADQEHVTNLAAAAADTIGTVDILVNNAGLAHAAALARTSLDDWNRIMAVNATGAFLCMRAFLPGMVERRWGRVVNVASTAGLRGDRYISAYAASKHALLGLTQCAAAEAAPHNVTVNAVCPGYLATEMTRQSVAHIMHTTGRTEEEALEAILRTTPQRRLIEPGEVADTVAFLCSAGAQAINGASVLMDGGELRR